MRKAMIDLKSCTDDATHVITMDITGFDIETAFQKIADKIKDFQNVKILSIYFFEDVR